METLTLLLFFQQNAVLHQRGEDKLEAEWCCPAELKFWRVFLSTGSGPEVAVIKYERLVHNEVYDKLSNAELLRKVDLVSSDAKHAQSSIWRRRLM